MARLDPALYRAARDVLAELEPGSPVIDVPEFRECGECCLVKVEALQRTGSFKFRSAYVALSLLSAEERRRGIVAYSSGNFGAGLSAASQVLQIPATVVVPHDAPQAKLRLIRAGGAKTVLVDPGGENREEFSARRARELAESTGSTLLHPFEDVRLLAGHAALVGDFLEEAKQRGCPLTHLYVPCGGAGLAGAAAWAAQLGAFTTTIVAVEPAVYPTLRASLAAGERVRLPRGETICDALQAPQVGSVAFSILRQSRCLAVSATDDMVMHAMGCLLRERKIVAEPSGALGLAGLLSRSVAVEGQRAGVIVTGGNVDGSILVDLVARESSLMN